MPNVPSVYSGTLTNMDAVQKNNHHEAFLTSEMSIAVFEVRHRCECKLRAVRHSQKAKILLDGTQMYIHPLDHSFNTISRYERDESLALWSGLWAADRLEELAILLSLCCSRSLREDIAALVVCWMNPLSVELLACRIIYCYSKSCQGFIMIMVGEFL